MGRHRRTCRGHVGSVSRKGNRTANSRRSSIFQSVERRGVCIVVGKVGSSLRRGRSLEEDPPSDPRLASPRKPRRQQLPLGELPLPTARGNHPRMRWKERSHYHPVPLPLPLPLPLPTARRNRPRMRWKERSHYHRLPLPLFPLRLPLPTAPRNRPGMKWKERIQAKAIIASFAIYFCAHVISFTYCRCHSLLSPSFSRFSKIIRYFFE